MGPLNSSFFRHARQGASFTGGLAFLLLAAVIPLPSAAQVPVTGRGKDFVAPVTDAQGRRTVIRGANAKPAGRGAVEIGGMQAQTYRGQQKDMTVQAPHCLFDTQANVAHSPGPLSIRTADERFSIEGKGYRWQVGDSRLTSKLVITNGVESFVRKGTIKRGAAAQSSAAPPAVQGPGTSSTGESASGASRDDFIQITAQEFEFQSDVAIFRGNVRVREAGGELACGILTVRFSDENGALERIEAEERVALTQGATQAFADKAIYTAGAEQDLVEFVGRAVWQDGGRAGSGEKISFDRLRRTVRAEGRAYLKVPRAALGDAGFLVTPTAARAAETKVGGDAAEIEIYADSLFVQLPLEKGPVQRIEAEKNVLIVDSERDGRALADHAIYTDATGLLLLTGSPLMEFERRLVNGGQLKYDQTTRTFTASPDAYVKLPFQSLMSLDILSGPLPAPGVGAQTNQFIEIWAKEFQYHTNRLQFQGDVRANFLEADVVLGKVTCGTLTIHVGEELERLVAEGEVELEQFGVPGAPGPVSRRVNCQLFTATFDAQGRLESARAEHDVTAEQEARRLEGQPPLFTRLRSESVTAFFSPSTNRVERIVAETDVLFAQEQRVAQGARAVYTGATGLLELTGKPTATMPEGRVLEAERLIWDTLNSRLIGKGKFKSQWKRPPSVSAAPVPAAE